MSISGKVINGVLTVHYEGTDYPLIKSNATAIESYLHTGDKVFLLALATAEDLARYGN